MHKWTSLIIGAVAGIATSAVYLYLFAPARETTFDERYQSRLDWALAEGKKAGQERELELRNELQQARINPPKPKTPTSEPLVPDNVAPDDDAPTVDDETDSSSDLK